MTGWGDREKEREGERNREGGMEGRKEGERSREGGKENYWALEHLARALLLFFICVQDVS